MAGIRIVTDSACDLPRDRAEERGIRVVPLAIRFGDEELLDRVELSAADFWHRLRDGAPIPKTAAPSQGAFETAFLEAADEGADGIVCVCLSSALSATYEAACAAAKSVANTVPVSVFDSLGFSLAQGMLVEAAWKAASEGRGLDAIVSDLTDQRQRTRVYGTIDSLEFLHRGGRIGGASALLGSMLSIKPVVEIRNGAVEQESRQRTRSRALSYLASKAAAAAPVEWVGIMNGAAGDLDEFVAQVKQALPGSDPLVVELGPVVGSHTGPGTLGVAFEVTKPGGPR